MHDLGFSSFAERTPQMRPTHEVHANSRAKLASHSAEHGLAPPPPRAQKTARRAGRPVKSMGIAPKPSNSGNVFGDRLSLVHFAPASASFVPTLAEIGPHIGCVWEAALCKVSIMGVAHGRHEGRSTGFGPEDGRPRLGSGRCSVVLAISLAAEPISEVPDRVETSKIGSVAKVGAIKPEYHPNPSP